MYNQQLDNRVINTKSTAAESKSPNNWSHVPAGGQFSSSKNRHANQGGTSARAGKNGGPKTKRGKERSRRNSLRHGIFSTVVLLEHEPSALFDSLLQGFRYDFQPDGVVEETLVEELATLKWRYRRMLNAEKAEIQVEERYNSQAANRHERDREEAQTFEASVEARAIEDEQNGITMPKPGLSARLSNPVIQRKMHRDSEIAPRGYRNERFFPRQGQAGHG